MKFTISNKFMSKLQKSTRIRDWWFSNHTAKKMWKRIKKIYKTYYKQTHATSPIEQLTVYPEDFNKQSNETIERGLNLFVNQGGLKSWSNQTVQNADAYLLVFNLENRSQERISKPNRAVLDRTPQEINLTELNLEPITQPEENVYTTSAENVYTKPEAPNNNTKVDSTLNLEQEPYEDDDYFNNMDNALPNDFDDNPGSPF